MKLITYFHTLKYLKFSQIYYRVFKWFRSPKPNSVVFDLSQISGGWVRSSLYQQKVFAGNKAQFLNREGFLGVSRVWNDPGYEKLWLYNLHYFDDLSAFGASSRVNLQVKLLNRWIQENPAPLGNGWEPYPMSLRIVNWIKAFLGHIKPTDDMLHSLAKQADFLSQNLERHLSGNHLFVNAKALIFVGLYLKGEFADRWLSVGLKIYKNELSEQVLSDGANFELTPMYHAIMLTDLLDLLNVFRVFSARIPVELVTATEIRVTKMLRWLEVMSHNDGKISFFNDGAFGVAPENRVIYEYARALGLKFSVEDAIPAGTLFMKNLVDSGYVVVKTNDYSLIADLAEVGPTYQPGHAHADTLSFEMTLYGKRLFVNSGTSEYGLSGERLRQRKTEAHNTVVVNGLDSSQVWSGFRVAKRARIVDRVVERVDQKTISFGASHDGFKQQGVDCLHRRVWRAQHGSISIIDTLEGDFDYAMGALYLHPDVDVVSLSNHEVKLSLHNDFVTLLVDAADITVEKSSWHPEFGVSFPSNKLCFTFLNSRMSIDIHWTGS